MILFSFLHYIELLPWALAGMIFHYLTKLSNAYTRKPDFSFAIFMQKNLFSIITSFWALLISVAIIVSSEVLRDNLTSVELVFVGYSASSFLKNLLKRKETNESKT